MSAGVDLSEFFDTFFDEADELLAEMEQLLLGLDPSAPDADDLNGIFRAAHSIKGGAATFGCFEELAKTTHLLENQLDLIRHGEMPLRQDMIDLFLETKDVLTEQVAAYRESGKPDQDAYERICAQLRQLALEQQAVSEAPPGSVSAASQSAPPGSAPAPAAAQSASPGSPQAPAAAPSASTGSSEVSAAAPSASTGSPQAPAAGATAAASPAVAAPGSAPSVSAAPSGEPSSVHPPSAAGGSAGLPLVVRVTRIQDKDVGPLSAEMALMGEVLHKEHQDGTLSIWLETTATASDLEAVCCFVVNADQVSVRPEAVPGAAPGDGPQAAARGSTAGEALLAEAARAVETAFAADPAPAGHPHSDLAHPTAGQPAGAHPESAAATSTAAASAAATGTAAGHTPTGSTPSKSAPAEAADQGTADSSARDAKAGKHKENGTIRVGVEKVDQIINLVGELVITQAMLVQTSQSLDPVLHDRLLNGIEQLERNARDLQEAVMSIRMMPMDYVFSRFPRVVRENATRMGKRIRLVTKGQATELDKSLIERIIDPLTHLVRNSLDHGIEMPEVRQAQGKDPEGTLTLSAQHNGGQIVIDVIDDGAGLNRERILKKAISQGFPVSDATPDEELWQLIFAPGFSTAEKVTDISGRGVGMDVVRRNIQGMGGHVQLSSRAGQGTTTRIVLPLTLAILDGMSVRVGAETFILPLSHVTESMQATAEQIHSISDTERMLHVRGEYLPIVALHEVFNVDGAETDLTRAIAVILQAEEMRFALMVDHLIGQHQVVVKNLEANYRKVPGISAATILGDGSVALIVDVFALRRTSTLRAVA